MDQPGLPGGWVSEVRRVGDPVARSQGARASFVYALLDHLARTGWAGAPRVRSVDHLRREETLTFIDGVVPWRPPVPDWALTDTALASLMHLVRDLHDLTAGTDLVKPGDAVSHPDLAPGNTVYRSSPSRPALVAFVDWDLAGPGHRVEDVAYVCWQWLGLGPPCATSSKRPAGSG